MVFFCTDVFFVRTLLQLNHMRERYNKGETSEELENEMNALSVEIIMN